MAMDGSPGCRRRVFHRRYEPSARQCRSATGALRVRHRGTAGRGPGRHADAPIRRTPPIQRAPRRCARDLGIASRCPNDADSACDRWFRGSRIPAHRGLACRIRSVGVDPDRVRISLQPLGRARHNRGHPHRQMGTRQRLWHLLPTESWTLRTGATRGRRGRPTGPSWPLGATRDRDLRGGAPGGGDHRFRHPGTERVAMDSRPADTRVRYRRQPHRSQLRPRSINARGTLRPSALLVAVRLGTHPARPRRPRRRLHDPWKHGPPSFPPRYADR